MSECFGTCFAEAVVARGVHLSRAKSACYVETQYLGAQDDLFIRTPRARELVPGAQ
jgi:hypothetical protein